MIELVWQQWVLIALYAFSLLVTIGRIGKARTPITPQEAVFSVIVISAMVALVVTI